MHCNNFLQPPVSRREMLAQCANGFGALALAALLGDPAYGADPTDKDPLLPKSPHFKAKAKNVIFLFMDGGPSQMDTFDPKPRLAKEHGQPIKVKIEPTQFNNVGTVLQSPWKFNNYGKSGIPVSDLFPNIGQCADDLCIIRSMVSEFSEHTNANYFLHSGTGQQGRPSMGSWVTYGLGSQCKNLPGFIVLHSGMIPPGGLDCFNSGFLPASFQGSLFQRGDVPVADLKRTESTAKLQEGKLGLMRKLDRGLVKRNGADDKLEAAIANYELAFRMQTAVADLMDLKGESDATKDLYGVNEQKTEIFGRQCLIARRLIERRVRFIELLCPNLGHDRWDQHSNLKGGHEANARAVDKPIAGLLKDLKSRGLLDSTLVIWGGEFGRTPMAQGSDGRGHNPFGYTMWLAGGGGKAGHIRRDTHGYGHHASGD